MIHIIPHHIGKGSWWNWYDMIDFQDSQVSIFSYADAAAVERKLLGEPPYHILLESHLSNMNIKLGDYIFVDALYFNVLLPTEELHNSIVSLAKKYFCKFFIIDYDNFGEYRDCEYYTYFSNRFQYNEDEVNFNYFRYRSPFYKFFKYLPEVVKPFLLNYRDKKMNMVLGVDKIERLLSVKHVYDIGLNKDSYVGFSGFNSNYDDDSISDSLLKFKKENLPIILDVDFERSCNGAVNVERPPIGLTMNSYVSCIIETQLILHNEIHTSEKCWNPFISFNIPLILGSLKLNEYLKKLGFWLADDLFDISTQTSFGGLMEQFKSNLNIIHNMSNKELHAYYVANYRNIESNYEIMQNQKFIFNPNLYKDRVFNSNAI